MADGGGSNSASGAPEGPAQGNLLLGSDGEHALQLRYGTRERAQGFYARQMLDFLAPTMKEFIARQELMFVATADRHGECDCTPKFGEPGFVQVLGDRHLIYPEYRGNGVFASLGNISENGHIALMILDLYRDSVGLHVNGKARIVENDELTAYLDRLPEKVVAELSGGSRRRPERWVMVEVEEAYIQCSKHIPLVTKIERTIDWGTDNAVAKGGDYFELKNLPLYDRLGGDKAMNAAVDVFQRRILDDPLMAKFFDDVDRVAARLKQKSFLAMAFGGPYPYSSSDLRRAHARLVDLGLTDLHFDRVAAILRATLEELALGPIEVDEVMAVVETTRDDILNR
jgi:truncated hemoglobin YjbI